MTGDARVPLAEVLAREHLLQLPRLLGRARGAAARAHAEKPALPAGGLARPGAHGEVHGAAAHAAGVRAAASPASAAAAAAAAAAAGHGESSTARRADAGRVQPCDRAPGGRVPAYLTRGS